jgi:hypothetical protein
MQRIISSTGNASILLLLLLLDNHGGSVSGLTAPVSLPDSGTALARQAATAIVSAFQDGIHRQTIKLPLSESMYKEKEEGFVADRAIGWQGGPQETYRYLQPLATTVLKEVSTRSAAEGSVSSSSGGLVAKVSEQVLLDFDGSSLLTAEHPAGPLYDIQAILQPNTDDYYSTKIAQIEQLFSDTPGKAKRMFLIVNPAWRDRSSWGFFGGARAQEQILDRYETVYALEQFVVRGYKVSLLRAWPHDWAAFWTPMPYDNDNDGRRPRLIGTFSKRPEYDELDSLLKTATANK